MDKCRPYPSGDRQESFISRRDSLSDCWRKAQSATEERQQARNGPGEGCDEVTRLLCQR